MRSFCGFWFDSYGLEHYWIRLITKMGHVTRFFQVFIYIYIYLYSIMIYTLPTYVCMNMQTNGRLQSMYPEERFNVMLHPLLSLSHTHIPIVRHILLTVCYNQRCRRICIHHGYIRIQFTD
jgi:hypothetical protein